MPPEVSQSGQTRPRPAPTRTGARARVLVHCCDMARVLAIANQKGGVAKTTTVHALGVALARLGDRVLLVDLDPQACLTFSVGLDPDELEVSLHDVLVGRNKSDDAVQDLGELSILPSSIDLAGTELFLL